MNIINLAFTAYGMTEAGCTHLPILLQEGANASSGVVVSNYSQKVSIVIKWKIKNIVFRS